MLTFRNGSWTRKKVQNRKHCDPANITMLPLVMAGDCGHTCCPRPYCNEGVVIYCLPNYNDVCTVIRAAHSENMSILGRYHWSERQWNNNERSASK